MNKKFKFTVLLLIVFTLSCSFYQGFLKSTPNQPNMHYVVIGCSAAGFYAAKELANLNRYAKVTCISEENSHPYNKTKFHSYIAKTGQISSKVDLVTGNFSNVEFLLSTKVLALNTTDKTIALADNKTLSYDKLLLATGARPQMPVHFETLMPSSHIRFYNTKEDLNAILSIVDENPSSHVVIVGAGIRSLELSDGLMRRHKETKLSLINRSRQFFGELGDAQSDEFIKKRLDALRINFIAPATISTIKEENKKLTIAYEHGQLQADLIVFTIGTVPNSKLAKNSHLELYEDGSIKVDDELKTSNNDIYAAGDVVGFKNTLGEGLVRSAKWRSSKKQGRIAAANMVGQHLIYKHEPAAFVTSFLGMQALLSGKVRSKPYEASIIEAENKGYYRYILENERLKSIITVWDKGQRRPNMFLLRRKLLDQTRVSASELLR